MSEKINGVYLKQLRLDRGWSQEELAARSIVDVKIVRKAENCGGVNPATLKKLADALGELPASVLLKREHDARTMASSVFINTVPPPPDMLIGREAILQKLINKLLRSHPHVDDVTVSSNAVVFGWAGVGKTALITTLAHDSIIGTEFSDGILWITLGPSVTPLSALVRAGGILRSDAIMRSATIQEGTELYRQELTNRRMLVVLDDVWKTAQVVPFLVKADGVAMIVTTRLPEVARTITCSPESRFAVLPLPVETAIELFRIFAPDVVREFRKECMELVVRVGGLPLGVKVASCLLQAEHDAGLDVRILLEELTHGPRLLETAVPTDCMDLVTGQLPSVATVLSKSIGALDLETREAFIKLGAFPPSPASFDLNALKSIWDQSDPRVTVRRLVDRGLLEPAEAGRYQLHSLLGDLARSLLGD